MVVSTFNFGYTCLLFKYHGPHLLNSSIQSVFDTTFKKNILATVMFFYHNHWYLYKDRISNILIQIRKV